MRFLDSRLKKYEFFTELLKTQQTNIIYLFFPKNKSDTYIHIIRIIFPCNKKNYSNKILIHILNILQKNFLIIPLREHLLRDGDY